MGENGLFTDAAVFLEVEDTDVIARLLPPKLEKWKQKRDKKLAKLKKKKDKAKKKRVCSFNVSNKYIFTNVFPKCLSIECISTRRAFYVIATALVS